MHIKAKRYDASEYRLFSAAEKAKHWQLLHPNEKPRGLNRGRGGGRRTDDDRDRKAPPSTISENSSKRAKAAESDDEHLFTPDDDLTASTNQKNTVLARSSPSGRQKNSDE